MHMRRIAICGLSGSTIFCHIIINGTIFEKKKKKVTEHKMCFDFTCKFCLKKFLIVKGTERDKIRNVCWSTCKLTVDILRF